MKKLLTIVLLLSSFIGYGQTYIAGGTVQGQFGSGYTNLKFNFASKGDVKIYTRAQVDSLITAAGGAYQLLSQKNQANGYAGLDANSHILPTYLGYNSGSAYDVLHGDGIFSGVNLNTSVYGILDISNGGTGSGTKNFVDLFTTQSVGGDKTYTGTNTFTGHETIFNTSSYTIFAGTVGNVFWDSNSEWSFTNGAKILENGFPTTSTPDYIYAAHNVSGNYVVSRLDPNYFATSVTRLADSAFNASTYVKKAGDETIHNTKTFDGDLIAPAGITFTGVNFISGSANLIFNSADYLSFHRDGLGEVFKMGVASGSLYNESLLDLILPNTVPTNANQAVPKFYIDNLITGITWKNAVNVATTGNVTLSGLQTIDGVAGGTYRVLVNHQTTATENGIYDERSGTWTRVIDADTGDEIITATVAVTKGTVNKNTQWTCTNATTPVIGTDNITFGQISGAGTYTNGPGMDLTANVFSLNTGYTRGLFGITSPLTYNSSTGVFGIQTASGSQAGAISSTDWATFNSKQNALSGTGFVKISGTTISYDNTAYASLSASNTFTGTTNSFVNPSSSNTYAGMFQNSNSSNGNAVVKITSQSASTISGFGAINAYRNINTVGAGNAILFSLNNSAGSEISYANIAGGIETNTSGSEGGFISFQTTTSGTARNERMHIAANGNVGINTSTPAVALDIVGTTQAGSTINVFSNTGGINPSIQVQSGASASFPLFSLVDGRASGNNWHIENGRVIGQLGFYNTTSGGLRMAIAPSGNVLIGSSTDDGANKLQVIGAVSATGNITSSGGSFIGGGLSSGANDTGIILQTRNYTASGTQTAIQILTGTISKTAGQFNGFAITPTYNEASGTSVANTDLLINRTETSLGTTPGNQRLLDLKVSSSSKFFVTNTGATTIGFSADVTGAPVGSISNILYDSAATSGTVLANMFRQNYTGALTSGSVQGTENYMKLTGGSKAAAYGIISNIEWGGTTGTATTIRAVQAGLSLSATGTTNIGEYNGFYSAGITNIGGTATGITVSGIAAQFRATAFTSTGVTYSGTKYSFLGDSGAGGLSISDNSTFLNDLTIGARLIAQGIVRLKGYTVATLPVGTQGDTAFVTDALAPTYLGLLTGGGTVVTSVFYNGTTWVAQ